ncbi:ATP-dependent DNA helicase DinG [soil metagenome]
MELQHALEKLYQTGLQPRHGQEQMMQCVQDTIINKRIAVIEGGTGIGKSYGYLLPALLNKAPKQTIIIATATVSLQEQLAHKDILQLSQKIQRDIKYVIAKGRQRYVCLQRLYQTEDAAQDDLFFEEQTRSNKLDETQFFTKLKATLETKSWDGDKDSYIDPILASAWSQVTTDGHRCIKKACEHFDECPYYKARKSLFHADVIITNHSLLLVEIALGTGSLLPSLEDAIIIIDEAHNFAEKAVEALSGSSTLLGAIDWLSTVAIINKRVNLQLSGFGHRTFAIEQLAQDISIQLREFHTVLNNYFLQHHIQTQWHPEVFPNDLLQQAALLASNTAKLRPKVKLLLDDIKLELTAQNALNAGARILSGLGFLCGKLDNLEHTFRLLATQATTTNEPPIAKWFTPTGVHKSGQLDFICHAAPINIAASLDKHFWSKTINAVVLCSATLQSLGNFNRFLDDSGLNLSAQKRVTTEAFLSPFDFAASNLIVPAMEVEPTVQDEKHTAEIIRLLPSLIAATGGSLVLFTSKRTMDQVYYAMRRHEYSKAILMQGQMARQDMLKQHTLTIKNGKKSILFGLHSLAEGVDLPGDLCKVLVITKLPFASPSTPVELTRHQWLKNMGKNPFRDHVLPEASMRLCQYVGRLIRQTTDRGTVYILDKRLYSKSYGKMLLRSLPPFTMQVGLLNQSKLMNNHVITTLS